MDKLTVRAYGKLNLYLDIVGTREDGYHLLRSVMQSVSVFDTLTFELTEGEGIKLLCDAPGFPTDRRNLIWKAADRFFEAAGITPRGRLRVTVDKRIPSMAGMAGGSADCSAALSALNELYGRPLTEEGLFSLAARLGADVPFTLSGGTVLCEGIGEKLTKLPTLKDVWFAAVKPEVSISTPEAYRAFDRLEKIERKSYDSFEAALKAGNTAVWADNMFNALEYAVNDPLIASVRKEMTVRGALGAMMTGSGSVVFGVFDSREAAKKCIDNMCGYPFAEVLEPSAVGTEITGVN